MNKVILMGRLTKDPEIRATQDGKRVASYTLAVDRKVAKQEQKADFISCTAWEKKAEFAEKYLSKGMKIAISGRLQTGSYTDRNGNTVYTTDVVVEDQEFCEKKAETIPDGLRKCFDEKPKEGKRRRDRAGWDPGGAWDPGPSWGRS